MLGTLLQLLLLLPAALTIHRISSGRRRVPLRRRLALLSNDRGDVGDGDDKDADGDQDGGDDSGDDEGKKDDTDGDAGDGDGEDWKSKYEAQQRINRKLERRTVKDAERIQQLSKNNTGDKKTGDADQPSAEQIREQARAEARQEILLERVTDKIEAKAARQFADPEDAVAILLRKHDTNDFLDDGKVDVEAIEDALKDLLEKKPHLAVQDGKRFKGSGDGGARKEQKTKPASLEAAIASRITGS